MINHIKLAQKIYQTAYLQGEFKLRSGAVSHEYFDKYLFEANPALLQEIAQAMNRFVPEDVDALAGLEMGGIPIATILSQVTGLPTLFVRKAAKPYGTCRLAEGGEVSGKKLLIVEDVVTSGGQIILSAEALRERGAIVENAVCVIDREANGRENLANAGLQLQSLFTMAELKTAVS